MEEWLMPTVRGYKLAFIALCKLLNNGKLHEDEYLILDIYVRMALNIKVEQLLEKLAKKPVVVVKENNFVKVIGVA